MGWYMVGVFVLGMIGGVGVVVVLGACMRSAQISREEEREIPR